ncbi:hypothetical protein BH10PSE17_BH10PSE17_10750 [soil metagenome]
MTWQRIDLVIEGGFAGLRRGASLDREAVDALDQSDAHRLTTLVGQICALPSPGAARHPDSESVAIDVVEGGQSICKRFDSADLPDAAAELLKWLRPQLKPLPRG